MELNAGIDLIYSSDPHGTQVELETLPYTAKLYFSSHIREVATPQGKNGKEVHYTNEILTSEQTCFFYTQALVP